MTNSMNYHALDTLSLAALIPLSEAVFELSDTLMVTLSHLYELLSKYNQQGREQDGISILHLIYDMLGTEYTKTIALLRGNSEAASYCLYGFAANLGELIEELSERGGA